MRCFKPIAGVLALLSGSCLATEYFVSTQAEFDAVKHAVLQQPGDAILLERGAQFAGMLAPKGTGTEVAPIRIDTYGDGERPRIHALGKNVETVP